MNSSVPKLVNAITSPLEGNSSNDNSCGNCIFDVMVDDTITVVAATSTTSTNITSSTDNNNIISAISIGDTDVDDDYYNDLPLLVDADDDVDTFATEYRARVLLLEFKDDDWKKRNDLRYSSVLVQDGLSSRPESIPWLSARHTQEAYDRMFMQLYNNDA